MTGVFDRAGETSNFRIFPEVRPPKEAASTGRPDTASGAGQLANFQEWSQETSAQFSRLRIQSPEGGLRGVCARVSIRRGEVILDIPLACLLTAETVKKSDLGVRMYWYAGELQSVQSCFAAFLFQEMRKSDSRWKPYLDIPPSSFPDLPLLYTQLVLALRYLRIMETSLRVLRLPWAEPDRAIRRLPPSAIPVADCLRGTREALPD